MNKVWKSLSILILTVLAAHPMSAAIYMKVEGVKGRVTAEGADKIEVASFQFLPANASGNRVQGNYIGTNAAGTEVPKNGKVSATIRNDAEKQYLLKLCQDRTSLTRLVIEGDGQRHVLENVSFESCPTGSLPHEQFTMNYRKCSTHAVNPDVANPELSNPELSNPEQANTELIGLTPTPMSVVAERLTLNGSGATLTLTKVGPGTLQFARAKDYPKLIVKLRDGRTWTFHELEEVHVTNAAPQPRSGRPNESISFNFGKMDGSPAGFQMTIKR